MKQTKRIITIVAVLLIVAMSVFGFAACNSGSDSSMLNYTIDSRNIYKTQAYMVVADDSVREWGKQDWATKSAEYTAKGWISISMANDFAKIYPDTVTRAETQYQG